MALARALGQRYLWVDALCILQDVEVVRQQTIDDMDRIFAQSLLTMVAGTCESANDPLPGVTTNRSWKQRYQKVSASLTLSAHFDFRDYLESTKYNERAWTFQEYQLANRLLVFAPNGQVYFLCREAVYSEEVIVGPDMEPDAALLDGADLIKLRPDPTKLWSVYERGVHHFTARRMTYEKDILNAFTGILRMICSERSLEGLPLPIFDLALLWQPQQQLERRQGFSSWSWAGWIGKVEWFDIYSLTYEGEGKTETERIASWMKLRSWIVWYSSWGTDVRSPAYIMDGPPWLRGTAPSAEQHEHRFPGLHHKFVPRPRSLARSLENLEPQRRHIRYLQFWTTSAYFEIEHDRNMNFPIRSLDPETTSKGLRLFTLHDRDGRACGWVLLNDNWVNRAANSDIRRQEFIILSEGRYSKVYPSPMKYSPDQTERPIVFEEFNVMMITTTGT
ncbi:hypothetical protein BDV96DRAFT_495340 [Lophiotrema nucula]|uniref:Heterokaryon incompatibility domain-containing protein n=1 Tax=Lophiotrema nucula TaxID=690887 RepID=A0A6A5Z5F9_9PLEO|nr:hypothetical protein BDV96DRAFT_495340 [Lophiotrema nucula]